MADLFGHTEPKEPFKDIRNTRDSVAEEKARLCLELGSLVTKCPASVSQGSIQKTRAWMENLKKAKKVLGSTRSTVPELKSAIQQMRSYE